MNCRMLVMQSLVPVAPLQHQYLQVETGDENGNCDYRQYARYPEKRQHSCISIFIVFEHSIVV